MRFAQKIVIRLHQKHQMDFPLEWAQVSQSLEQRYLALSTQHLALSDVSTVCIKISISIPISLDYLIQPIKPLDQKCTHCTCFDYFPLQRLLNSCLSIWFGLYSRLITSSTNCLSLGLLEFNKRNCYFHHTFYYLHHTFFYLHHTFYYLHLTITLVI